MLQLTEKKSLCTHNTEMLVRLLSLIRLTMIELKLSFPDPGRADKAPEVKALGRGQLAAIEAALRRPGQLILHQDRRRRRRHRVLADRHRRQQRRHESRQQGEVLVQGHQDLRRLVLEPGTSRRDGLRAALEEGGFEPGQTHFR